MFKRKKKRLYSYDNFEGDKGVIIAKSLEEACEIYKTHYPDRKIANTEEEYWDNGGYIIEEDVLDGKSVLYNTTPW